MKKIIILATGLFCMIGNLSASLAIETEEQGVQSPAQIIDTLRSEDLVVLGGSQTNIQEGLDCLVRQKIAEAYPNLQNTLKFLKLANLSFMDYLHPVLVSEYVNTSFFEADFTQAKMNSVRGYQSLLEKRLKKLTFMDMTDGNDRESEDKILRLVPGYKEFVLVTTGKSFEELASETSEASE